MHVTVIYPELKLPGVRFIEGQRGISISKLFTIHVFDRSVHWSTSLWSPHTVRRSSTNLMGIKACLSTLNPYRGSPRSFPTQPFYDFTSSHFTISRHSRSLLVIFTLITLAIPIYHAAQTSFPLYGSCDRRLYCPYPSSSSCQWRCQMRSGMRDTSSVVMRLRPHPPFDENTTDAQAIASIVRYAARECGPRRPANWLWGGLTLWFLILKDMDKHAYLVNSLRNSQ